MSSLFTELLECHHADNLCQNARVHFVSVTASIEDAILVDDDDAIFVVDLSCEHLSTDARPRRKRVLSLSDCSSAEENMDELMDAARVRYVPMDASIEDAILADDDNERFIVNLRYEHLPSDARLKGQQFRILSECSSADEEIVRMDELMDAAPEPAIQIELRPYQDELAMFALQGKNTVVCAPTGSGKTIVAIKIICEHLLEGERMEQKRKVCFLVPSTVLVEQQEKLINCYLKHRWVVKGLSGSETAPKVPTVRSAHVIVITPQLIV